MSGLVGICQTVPVPGAYVKEPQRPPAGTPEGPRPALHAAIRVRQSPDSVPGAFLPGTWSGARMVASPGYGLDQSVELYQS